MSYFSKFIQTISSFFQKDIYSLEKSESDAHLELKKSNWGRDYGWIIVFDGQDVGELVQPTFQDMFWVEYKIIPYNDFEVFLLNSDNWLENDFKYRNKHYNQFPENAFCSGEGIRKVGEDSIINMRGLYLNE